MSELEDRIDLLSYRLDELWDEAKPSERLATIVALIANKVDERELSEMMCGT